MRSTHCYFQLQITIGAIRKENETDFHPSSELVLSFLQQPMRRLSSVQIIVTFHLWLKIKIKGKIKGKTIDFHPKKPTVQQC